MRSVLKYPLTTVETFVPVGRVLHIGEQHNTVTAWVEVDVEHFNSLEQKLIIVGTGCRPPLRCYHVGTVQMLSGLVWHVYTTHILAAPVG